MVSSERPQPDHYATLGLAPDASSHEIETAFHARVREHLQHANVADKPIREKARQVGLAYETLRDPAKRRAYDEARAAAAAEEEAVVPVALGAGAEAERPIMFGAREAFEPQVDDGPPASPEALAPEPLPEPQPEPEPEPEPEPQPHPEPEAEAEPPAPPLFAVTAPVIAAAAVEPESAPLVEPQAEADTRAEHEIPWEDEAPAAASYDGGGGEVAVADETALAPWVERRPSRVHRGVLAAGAAVIVLGVGGLLLARAGHQTGPMARRVVVPLPASSGQSAAGSPGDVQAPSAPGVTQPAQSGDLVQQTAPIAPTSIPSQVSSAAKTQPPPIDSTAAATAPASPPGATVEVKLPPPSPPSGPAAASPSPAASAATQQQAPAAQAAPAPPPPAPAAAAPVPARSIQPFPRWLGGGIMNSDNPGGQFQGTVSVRFTVEPNGGVSDCRPVASSGNPALDARTCALVEQRLRFSPALNPRGQPIATQVSTTYTWGRVMRRR